MRVYYKLYQDVKKNFHFFEQMGFFLQIDSVIITFFQQVLNHIK
jgi:hypothetical protein